MRRIRVILLATWLAAFGVGRAQLSTVTLFTGTGSQSTAFFDVADKWEVQWLAPDITAITVLAPDGSVVAGASGTGSGSLFLSKGGKYYLQVTRAAGSSDPWHASIFQVGAATTTDVALSSVAAVSKTAADSPTTAAAPNAPPTAPPAAGAGLSDAQARAIVLIKGDKGEGTGFLVKTADGPSVVTNQHVIFANPNIRIITTAGEEIKTLGMKGAPDRDLVIFSIADDHYSYLDLADDVSKSAQVGDEVLTPGNSEGGEVMLDTKGTVLGMGPDRIEISNPIFHGNSGGPVLDTRTDKVIGVVSFGAAVRPSDALDRSSLASKDSAISGSMRYFALRLDTVPRWEPIDWQRFLNETTFLVNFHDLSRCLDSYMNGAEYERMRVASEDENGRPTARYYLKNDKLVAIHNNYHQMTADTDDSQKMDARRETIMDLQGLAATDMNTIQALDNFYGFNAVRAGGEIKYRQWLQKEIESAGDKISDMGH